MLSMHEVAGSIPATSTFASPSPGINPTPNKMILLSNIFYETFLFDAMRHLEEKFSQKAISLVEFVVIEILREVGKISSKTKVIWTLPESNRRPRAC